MLAFQRQTEPCFYLSNAPLPEARGAAPSLSPLPGTPAFLSPGTRVAGASEAVSLKGSTASKQEALVCHQRDSPSRHRLCPRDLLSAGERGAAGKNLLSPKHARVRRHRAAAATLTAVGSGHTFPFGQRTPCPPGQRGPTIHAEDPLSSGAEETLPSMQRRPATRGRWDPTIWGRGNPAIHAETPRHPGQRGPRHPGQRRPCHLGQREPRHPCRGAPRPGAEGTQPSMQRGPRHPGLPHMWMALTEPTCASPVVDFFLASVWQVKASHSAKGGGGFGGLWAALYLSPKQAPWMRQLKRDVSPAA